VTQEMRGPDEARAEFVKQLGLLHRAAGRPAHRQISTAIRRDSQMDDTVSHETVGSILRGHGTPKWIKVKCVVQHLASIAVHHPDLDDEVQRFHALWLKMTDPDQSGARETAGPLQPGATVATPIPSHRPSTSPAPPLSIRPSRRATGLTRGTLPDQLPGFTGRSQFFSTIRTCLSAEPWQPVVLYGIGGVGKTRLALEYAHREAASYDLVVWIEAEQVPQATSAVAAIGEFLEMQPSEDMRQTVTRVLNRLESGHERWLLIFNNVGDPEEITSLLPAVGGHLLVVRRDPAWPVPARAIEVVPMTRRESIELLQRRGHEIGFEQADKLAELLGDLPLALEQVATMQSETRTPAQVYLRRLTEHAPELLAEGKAQDYPTSLERVFAVALDGLRRESSVAAQLLELLSCLGAEPVPRTLLSSGGQGVAPPLGRMLDQPDQLNDAVRRLRRYGLASYDADRERIQLHRLAQAIVRDQLSEEQRQRAYENAHALLAAANPGRPDEVATWQLHKEIGPHVTPSGLLRRLDAHSRQVILDQTRYRFVNGDFEGSYRLADAALEAWAEVGGESDDEQTFYCRRNMASALQAMGQQDQFVDMTEEMYGVLRNHRSYGPDHPLTVLVEGNLALGYRAGGRYQAALDIERSRRALHERRAPDGEETLVVRSNVAVTLRLMGRYEESYEIDHDLVQIRERRAGPTGIDTLFSVSNLARDLLGMGRYAEALEKQEETAEAYRDELGDRHIYVLLARRTIVIGLRKTGQFAEAVRRGGELVVAVRSRWGLDHEHSLAAQMTYANALREAGSLNPAWNEATDAVHRYHRHFGAKHPFTLAATANLAIINRAIGERQAALRLDESALQDMRQALGLNHPYTLATAVGLANDRVLDRDYDVARGLLERTLTDAYTAGRGNHPDTLICAINLGLLRQQDRRGDTTLLDTSVNSLRNALGPHHPIVLAAERGEPGDCDIEPPPT